MAGEDVRALEVVSRYKAPGDLMKAFLEQRTKLSQRAETPKISDTSTPEQIAEYRKAFDVPDVPKEAKDAAYADAYGIKPPEGYELGETEKQMLGAFAKKMNAAHAPKAFVQKAVAEHFEIQRATLANAGKIADGKAKEWANALRDEWGHREYDGRLAAANAYVQQRFSDRPEAWESLRLAVLPDGGRLGDHPEFIKMLVDSAMASGFTDRIEANAMESGGKSLAEQQREIEALMFSNPAVYNEAAKTGGRLDKIIGARRSRGELDEHGNETRRRAS